ncbi:hypothetical protein, partial [Streptomyces bohaiensis]|uniref:hypothetical protein n=1 Tax=Streptomyces bohaiensis TaxID=1431344 RepID=UPI003B78C114
MNSRTDRPPDSLDIFAVEAVPVVKRLFRRTIQEGESQGPIQRPKVGVTQRNLNVRARTEVHFSLP